MGNLVKKGDFVRFYDCQSANKDKDYSGKNQKYYPIGTIISVYDYTSRDGFTDRVCDIQVGRRISEAHFVSWVTLIN